MALLAASFFMTGPMLRLLPGAFRALERDLGLAPSQMAAVNAMLGIGFAVSGVILGFLGDHGLSRKWIICGCLAVGGVALVVFAMSSAFWAMAALCGVVGSAVGFVLPATTIIPELAPKEHLGLWMGSCPTAGVVGGALGLAVGIAWSTSTIWGFCGWRVLFMAVGALCLSIAAVVGVGMRKDVRPWRFKDIRVWDECAAAAELCGTVTLALIFGVNVLRVGAIGALTAFLPPYLQWSGLSDLKAALLMGAHMLLRAASVPLGGLVADFLHRRSQVHGRPLAGQLAWAGFAMLTFLTFGVANDPWVAYSAITASALFHSWHHGWCDPIIIELVQPGRLGAVLGMINLWASLAGFLLGPPIAAFLAEQVFGYQKRTADRIAAGRGRDIQDIPWQRREANTSALSQAILWCTLVPVAACFVLTTVIHVTLRADRLAARKASASRDSV